METKPYRLQSPEDIAKDYGGNKQKIAQAMQMGIIDPTAGVLAGMFIDRMRSAQMQEQAPQATVAQQVMGGAPPVPPSAPAGGLGATPQAAPPMAPQGGAPMAPPAQAAPPMGAPPPGMAAGGVFEAPYMSGGGLSELPLPDTMFDENRDGGYADGGIVAFAGGSPGELTDPSDYGAYIEQLALSTFPGLQIAGRARTPERNARLPGAVANSYHLIDAARDLRTPPGMSKAEFIAKLKETFGPQYDVLPSGGNSVHVEPGPALGKQVRAGSAGAPGAKSASPAASSGKAPWGGSIMDAVPGAFKTGEEYYAANMPERKNEGLNLLAEEARKTLDPAQMKKAANEDKWATLAQIGFNMAASNSPYLLQAVGAAAAAALPGAKADKKEREAKKREAIRDLATVEDITYKQAMDKANYVRDFAKDMLGLKNSDLTRAFEQQKTVFQEGEQTKRTGMQVAGGLEQARIGAKAQSSYFDKQLVSQVMGARGKATAAFDEARSNTGTRIGGLQAQIDSEKDPKRKAALEAQMNSARSDYIKNYVLDATGYDITAGMPGAQGSQFGAPPEGAVERVK